MNNLQTAYRHFWYLAFGAVATLAGFAAARTTLSREAGYEGHDDTAAPFLGDQPPESTSAFMDQLPTHPLDQPNGEWEYSLRGTTESACLDGKEGTRFLAGLMRDPKSTFRMPALGSDSHRWEQWFDSIRDLQSEVDFNLNLAILQL